MKLYIVMSRMSGEDWREIKAFKDEQPAKSLAKAITDTNKKETKVVIVNRKK